MSDEPDIIINGTKCTSAQSMAIRVALNSFLFELQNNGLGDDEIGRGICNGYQDRIYEIQNLMMKENNNDT